MSKVTLTVWRDAKTDPPAHAGFYRTDIGLHYWSAWDKCWRSGSPDGALGEPVSPAVWHPDPTPPGDDGLTMADLRSVLWFVDTMLDQVGPLRDENVVAFRVQTSHLRRALEEAEGQDGRV